ncbi:MAG: peptidoglycan-binding domain-containing protein [Candidatus Latescibacteria bacterium]|jgi:hypothetical protein|nr:peptidoglycan-binding domain-containing protein [Candidatus Latescibacterota bacterium]
MGLDSSVSGQLVGSPAPIRSRLSSTTIVLVALVVAMAAAVWSGIRLESNPVDRVARCLAELPLALLLVDLLVLAILLARRRSCEIPTAVTAIPPVVAGAHVALWVLARHLVSFEVFYGLEPTAEMWRPYAVRGWIVAGLGLATLLSAGTATLQVYLLRWSVQWIPLPGSRASGAWEAALEPDAMAEQEHVYEAQVILQSLGYDVEGIDGEMDEATSSALRQFQEASDLEARGELTMLSLIELRNRWRSQQEMKPGQSSKAVLGHVARRMSEWIGGRRRLGA